MNPCDRWLKQYYGVLPFEEYAMLDRAARILEGNRTGLVPGDASPWLPLRGITPSDRYSLPSGHTAAAFLMATVLAASFPLWAPLLFTWAILVGASRLLLGVHYLSDLVAGALLGSGCALWALGWSQG